jgi:hypothetical protein
MRTGRWTSGLLAGCLALAACGVSPQRAPERVPPDRLPAASPQATAPVVQARVWVARGDRVVPVLVELRSPGLSGRLGALLALRTSEPTLPTAIPAGTLLLGNPRREGEVAEVHLSGQLLSAADKVVPLALAQLVLTATEEPGVRAVEVRSGGQRVTLADARDRPLQRPLRRDDFAIYVRGGLD